MRCGLYVFGYGSLVSPDSVAQTLGHVVDRSRIRPAHLSGWDRAWNVGSDHHSHPERTFYLNGEVFTGVTVILGIQPGAGCDGAVFPVLAADLALLDVRERNYDRVDVSDRVTWPGKPSGCVVHTYVPKPSATAKALRAPRRNVRREYLELVERAFASIGAPPPSPPDDDLPIVGMTSIVHQTPDPAATGDETVEPTLVT